MDQGGSPYLVVWYLVVLFTALLRHTSSVQRMFSWISRHLERVYGDGWVAEAKIKDTGKKKLKLIVTKDKQGSVWGKTRQKILGGVKGGGGTYINPEKGGGYMNLEKIYVCACIWRTEIKYLVYKNGHSWVQIGGRYATGGGEQG